jgi:hypothetical protein
MPDNQQTADGAAAGGNWSLKDISEMAAMLNVSPDEVMQQIKDGQLHLSSRDAEVGPVSQFEPATAGGAGPAVAPHVAGAPAPAGGVHPAVSFNDLVDHVKNNPDAFVERLVRNGKVRVAVQPAPAPRTDN